MFGRKKNKNRNLADQSSKRVYSYYSNTRLRSDDQSGRARISGLTARIPKAKVWWRHAPSILALAAIFICLGYVLSLNTNPKVVQINNNNGVFLQSKTTYQIAAQEIINKSLLNHNKVTLNVNGISQQLKAQFPELDDVSITIPLINRQPIIYITASRPAMILQSNNSATLIDNRGIAILPAYQVKNLSILKLPTVKDDSNISISYGKSVLTSTSVKFITEVNQQFTAQSLKIDQLALPTTANELDVRLSGAKYYIKMDTTGDSREQVGAYIAAIKKIDQLNGNVKQYLDVRVPGRVFYK